MDKQKNISGKRRIPCQVAVIGAGASGLMAAIAAARAGAAVTILEQKDKVGKKILATGNGHCNFTNDRMDISCYHGNAFAIHMIEKFPVTDTIAFFRELGIFPHERNGYYYPASEQASAVVKLLLREAEELGVAIRTDTRVAEIRKNPGNQYFLIDYEKTLRSDVKEVVRKNGKKKQIAGEVRVEQGQCKAERVILAGGGMASPNLGSDGSCYTLAQKLGHRVITPLPALTGIRCEENWFKQLAGIRVSAKVTLLVEGREIASDTGELQLTEYGISGIPVFQISRYAARALAEKKKVEAKLLFYPEISDEEMADYLQTHGEEQYCGLFPEKLLQVLMTRHMEDDFCQKAADREQADRRTRLDTINKKKSGRDHSNRMVRRELLCTCREINGFDRAQVTCGGIALEEVHPETLESLRCPGLYLAGEVLDVDGICGGYNLQWAWSSGWVAGKSAAAGSVHHQPVRETHKAI